MPINIQTGPLSALKVGHENVSSSYIGHQQIFPNSTTIQSAEFTDISTLGYNGGTRNFRIIDFRIIYVKLESKLAY